MLPWLIPDVAAAAIWNLMFRGYPQGLLNLFLSEILGLHQFKNFGWLAQTDTSLFSVMLVQIWKSFGFFTIAILGGMQSISKDLYDAARVDGVNWFQKFKYVTIPGITPILVILMLLNSIWTFKSFGLVYVLTRGGPANSSMVLGMYAWLTAFFLRGVQSRSRDGCFNITHDNGD